MHRFAGVHTPVADCRGAGPRTRIRHRSAHPEISDPFRVHSTAGTCLTSSLILSWVTGTPECIADKLTPERAPEQTGGGLTEGPAAPVP